MKKKISVLLVLALLVGLLSGCAATAESVVTKTAEAMADKTLTKVSFEAPLLIQITEGGEEESIDLKLNGTYWYAEEPAAMYGEIRYEGDIMGQWISDMAEIYLNENEDGYEMYVYSKLADLWVRQQLSMDEEESEGVTLSFSGTETIDVTSHNLVLEEETQTIGDSEAYVLHYSFGGQSIQDEFEAQGGFSGILEKTMETEDLTEEEQAILEQLDMSALDALNFAVLELPVTMYIDKSSYEVKQMDLQVVGLQSLMEQMTDALLLMAKELSDEEIEEDISFVIGDMSMVLTDLSYEPVEVKAVPEEAVIICDQQEFEALQEDGSYIIQELGEAVRVVPHWTLDVTEYAYNYVQAEDKYDNKLARYTMLDKDEGVKDIERLIESNAAELKEEGFKVEITEDSFDEYTMKSIHANSAYHIHYLWKQVGDRILLVEAYNFITLAQDVFLKETLGGISEYQLP